MSTQPRRSFAAALTALALVGLGTTTAHAQLPSSTGSSSTTATSATSATTSTGSISFVASASRSANVSVPTVSVPASVQAGDTLVLTASLGHATTATGPGGWTLKGDQNATTALRTLVWVRTATAADAGRSVAVTMETIHKSALAVTAYRGVDTDQAITATASTDANTANHTTPAVTVPDRARVMSFWADRGAATTRWAVPTGQSMRTSAVSTGSGRVSAAVADPDTAASGAVTGSTATTDAVSTLGVSWSIVLPSENTPPVATFSQDCSGQTCELDSSGSADPDGSIASSSWTFGDTTSGTGPLVTHTYAGTGTYVVQLTVVDNSGATATMSSSVSVTPSTVFGMNVSPGTSFTNGTSESAAVQVNRIVGTYGTLGAAKIFYSGALPATFNKNYEGLVPGKQVAVCFKPNQTQLANGSLNAAINGYINSIPAGWKVMLVNWQEPDDEMWKDNVFTMEQHRAATEKLIDVARANPAYAAGRVEVWDVYMGYSLDVGRWKDAAASPRLDGIGWDYYWNKPTTSWSTDPSVALKKMADTNKRIGIEDWGLFETGDNPHSNDPDGSGRAAFWKKVYTDSEALGYDYVLYFNAIGTTGDHRILPGTAFGDPVAGYLRTKMNP